MIDRQRMEESLYNDSMLYSFEKGIKQGEERGIKEMVRALKAKNVPKETIAEASGLTLDEIEKL